MRELERIETRIEEEEQRMRSGYRTTEFWLSLAAVLVGALLAAGVFPAESPWTRALGAVAMALAAAGYSASRGRAKGGGGSSYGGGL